MVEVGIVDYGVGNLRSVANAVEYVGATPRVSSDAEVLRNCERLILPGVGAFAHGMASLEDRGLDVVVKEYVSHGGYCLGICLGMQLLHELSREFDQTPGLGLVPGEVKKITSYATANNPDYRLPNVGWRSVDYQSGKSDLTDRMMRHVEPQDSFYFIHGFAVSSDHPAAVGVSRFSDIPFASIVANDNLVGTQFHPEKSREVGLKMLKAFVH